MGRVPCWSGDEEGTRAGDGGDPSGAIPANDLSGEAGPLGGTVSVFAVSSGFRAGGEDRME